MSIWGKIVGAAAGLALGGPIGALIGAVAGHAVDRLADPRRPGGRREPPDLLDEAAGDPGRGEEEAATRKVAFTVAVIALSAKMAKADGVVTRDEIAAFREVFHVPPEEVRNVGRIWDRARRDTAGFEAYARQVARLFNPGSPVLEELLGCLFHIAGADGVLHHREIAYLRRVAALFGFDEAAFARLRALHGDGGGEDDPYRALGLTADADDATVKATWRKLIREHHPDRLIAEGLPEEFIRAATERTAAINAAYDRIAKQRGLN